MTEDSRPAETTDGRQENLRPYYKRLLLIAFIALVVSGLWCLFPFWKASFSGSQLPGIYWLFVAESSSTSWCAALFLLGGIGIFCFGHMFRATYPDEVRRHLMRIDELRDATVLLGAAIGLAIMFRLGMRIFLFDFFAMENMSSVATENHVYHLSFYNTGSFSDGVPYGLIECDTRDIVCEQIEMMFIRETSDSSGPEQPTVVYDDVTGTPYITVTDNNPNWGIDASLRYDDVTRTLYMESDGQTYYSYQLEE